MMDNPKTIYMGNVLTRFVDHKTQFLDAVAKEYSYLLYAAEAERQRYKEVLNHRKNHEDAFSTACGMPLMLINRKLIKRLLKIAGLWRSVLLPK